MKATNKSITLAVCCLMAYVLVNYFHPELVLEGMRARGDVDVQWISGDTESVCTGLEESENNLFILETLIDFPVATSLVAVESAALHNPGYCVNLVFIQSDLKPRSSYAPSQILGFEGAFKKLVDVYGNIRQLKMTLGEATKDTVLQDLALSVLFRKNENQKTKIVQTSDMVRYALVYKYGGIYIDSDNIVLRTLNSSRDYLMANGNPTGVAVMNSVLKLRRHSRLLELAMETCAQEYRPEKYSLLMMFLQRHVYLLCAPVNNGGSGEFCTCSRNRTADFSVMKPGRGISTVMNRLLLKVVGANALETIRNESSRLVHNSQSFASPAPVELIHGNTTLAYLFRHNCPVLRNSFSTLYL